MGRDNLRTRLAGLFGRALFAGLLTVANWRNRRRKRRSVIG